MVSSDGVSTTFAVVAAAGDAFRSEESTGDAGTDATEAVFHAADAADSSADCANADLLALVASANAAIAAANRHRGRPLFDAPSLFILYHTALSFELAQMRTD